MLITETPYAITCGSKKIKENHGALEKNTAEASAVARGQDARNRKQKQSAHSQIRFLDVLRRKWALT